MIIALLAACAECGGGGRCEFPPCDPPTPRCDSDADCFESELCDFQGDSCGAASEVGTNRSCSCLSGFGNCTETDGGFRITQMAFPDPADATSSAAALRASTRASR